MTEQTILCSQASRTSLKNNYLPQGLSFSVSDEERKEKVRQLDQRTEMSLISYLNSASSRASLPPKVYHSYYISHLSKRLFNTSSLFSSVVLLLVYIPLSLPWVLGCLHCKYSLAPQAQGRRKGGGKGQKGFSEDSAPTEAAHTKHGHCKILCRIARTF